MKKSLYFITLSVLGGFSMSCNKTSPAPTPTPIVLTDSTGQNNRAVDVRNLSVDEVFMRIPKPSLEMEGLEKMDDKARKALLEHGSWGGYKIKRENNWITLSEDFQNDDDPAERINLAQIGIFTQQESGYKHVIILKKQLAEDDKEWQQLSAKQLWEFDGKTWEDLSLKLPNITTAQFFKPKFDLKGNTQDFIRLEPSATDPYQIKASLMYHLYSKSTPKLSDKYLIDNEAFSVSLYWGGESIGLVVEPFTTTK